MPLIGVIQMTDVKLEILDYLKNLDEYHLLLVLSFLKELLAD